MLYVSLTPVASSELEVVEDDDPLGEYFQDKGGKNKNNQKSYKSPFDDVIFWNLKSNKLKWYQINTFVHTEKQNKQNKQNRVATKQPSYKASLY
jgi:hypothetical protein